ncbi:hypothetical protein TRFO_12247 [Tritrichomonas foetus]|uniref:Uncharacterized protein n=1 Tax=Tritrichomonas foetus TaxID=1144522 RepID=A0A1J4J5F8_9EUKA|nr:hypothetical protein TRFO_12247 [Tritrichomonas foetus]|eukprot:OHS92875.1 hypothetical protein TRFO_12247 [Tritrichomonas foetus]
MKNVFFASSRGEVYDSEYNKTAKTVNKIVPFPQMPENSIVLRNPNSDSNCRQEALVNEKENFTKAIQNWTKAIYKENYSVILPIPISLSSYLPACMNIAQLKSRRNKLIPKKFDFSSQPPPPPTFLSIFNTLISNDDEDFRDVNVTGYGLDKYVQLNVLCRPTLKFGTNLIPQEPIPELFDNFISYKKSLQKWIQVEKVDDEICQHPSSFEPILGKRQMNNTIENSDNSSNSNFKYNPEIFHSYQKKRQSQKSFFHPVIDQYLKENAENPKKSPQKLFHDNTIITSLFNSVKNDEKLRLPSHDQIKLPQVDIIISDFEKGTVDASNPQFVKLTRTLKIFNEVDNEPININEKNPPRFSAQVQESLIAMLHSITRENSHRCKVFKNVASMLVNLSKYPLISTLMFPPRVASNVAEIFVEYGGVEYSPQIYPNIDEINNVIEDSDNLVFSQNHQNLSQTEQTDLDLISNCQNLHNDTNTLQNEENSAVKHENLDNSREKSLRRDSSLSTRDTQCEESFNALCQFMFAAQALKVLEKFFIIFDDKQNHSPRRKKKKGKIDRSKSAFGSIFEQINLQQMAVLKSAKSMLIAEHDNIFKVISRPTHTKLHFAMIHLLLDFLPEGLVQFFQSVNNFGLFEWMINLQEKYYFGQLCSHILSITPKHPSFSIAFSNDFIRIAPFFFDSFIKAQQKSLYNINNNLNYGINNSPHNNQSVINHNNIGFTDLRNVSLHSQGLKSPEIPFFNQKEPDNFSSACHFLAHLLNNEIETVFPVDTFKKLFSAALKLSEIHIIQESCLDLLTSICIVFRRRLLKNDCEFQKMSQYFLTSIVTAFENIKTEHNDEKILSAVYALLPLVSNELAESVFETVFVMKMASNNSEEANVAWKIFRKNPNAVPKFKASKEFDGEKLEKLSFVAKMHFLLLINGYTEDLKQDDNVQIKSTTFRFFVNTSESAALLESFKKKESYIKKQWKWRGLYKAVCNAYRL